jgi:hypothetical protein
MPKQLFLYLISHDRKDIKTHTYIGCVQDFIKRLQQHNGQLPGGPRITRRAAGSWDPVIVLKLPNDRKFNSKEIKKQWKQTSRGLESRIRKGFEIAVKYNLTCYIMKQQKKKIPILNYFSDKWEDNKVKCTEKDWEKILNSDI